MKKIEIDRKYLGIGDKFNFVNSSESYKYIGLYGTNATIKATPNTGYKFVSWQESGRDISVENPYIFKILQDKIISAKFELNRFDVKLTNTTGGAVTGGGSFDYGKDTKLTANPQTGYSFTGWYESGALLSKDNPYILTVVKARNIEGRFSINKYSVNATAGTGGKVTGAGNYDYNSTATLTAISDTGYSFAGWYENGTKVSTSPSYIFNVTNTRNIQAQFTPNKYSVNISTLEVHGTAIGAGSYDYGTSVTVKVTVPTEADFLGWYQNGNLVSSNINYTFTLKNNIYLEARFKIVYFKVKVYGSNVSQGDFTVKRGESLNLNCETYRPNSSASFGHWKEYTTEGKILSRNCQFTYTPTKDIVIHPYFIIY
jgi:hypothetical protein